jgi:cyclohexanecarboxylate-CoA ligase
VRLPLHLRARLVLQEAWDPAVVVRLIETERISFSLGATPILSDTLRASNLADPRPQPFCLFVCGGAHIPRISRAGGRSSIAEPAGAGLGDDGEQRGHGCPA